MPQLFGPAANTWARAVLVLVPIALAGLATALYVDARSDATWNVGQPAAQPIPFRHDIHAGTLGVACGYCHSTAERTAFAGMPSAQTCMTCHAQVWVGASVLQPLRNSLALDQPIAWVSVNRLPDFVYFNHAAHVSTGVACATCHGDMTRMPKLVRAHSLSMGWCLDCHREPQRYLSPAEAAAIAGSAAAPRAAAGEALASPPAGLPELYREGDPHGLYQAVRRHLTSCNTCHH